MPSFAGGPNVSSDPRQLVLGELRPAVLLVQHHAPRAGRCPRTWRTIAMIWIVRRATQRIDP
jgi:hypothetical protein